MKYLALTLSILASLAAAVPAKAGWQSCTTICNPQGTWCSTNCI